MESVTVASAKFTLRDDGIFEIEHQVGVEATAERVPDQIAAVFGLIGDKPRPLLWKPHREPFTDVGAWREWMGVATKVAVAIADAQAAVDAAKAKGGTFTEVERLVEEARAAGREGDESRAWELATEAQRRLN